MAHALIGRLAAAHSIRSRRRKAAALVRLIAVDEIQSVLLVGVEAAEYAWSNIVEQAVIGSGAWVVASGLGPEILAAGNRVICDGRQLPFRDKSFDLVVSNAVIEHVGGEQDQRAFVAEHHRVGSRFVITTPNLWFPVESHARVLFRHWSPAWRARHGALFTRLLSRWSFVRLLPTSDTRIRGLWWSPSFSAAHTCNDTCGIARSRSVVATRGLD